MPSSGGGGAARARPAALPPPPHPPDPVLSELLTALRRRGPAGVPLYKIVDGAAFNPYRRLLKRRRPDVRRYAEPSRVVASFAAFGTSLGLCAHALAAGVPVPLVDGDPAVWVVLWFPVAALLWLAACLWPGDRTRRWRSFNRYCRRRLDAALAGLPAGTRAALDKGASKPVPPRPRPRPEPSRPGRKSQDFGDWADAVGTDSCGGGGCGGSD
ncbi:hypothetical protein [Streptomyces sp. NPDC058953]|uniref:hypothetical protein n=1 Tax=Streptomyces sp. NPDC058953 TaxID=3346676 RepID=UPI0036A62FFE